MSGFGASESLLGGFADPNLSNIANLFLLVLLQASFLDILTLINCAVF